MWFTKGWFSSKHLKKSLSAVFAIAPSELTAESLRVVSDFSLDSRMVSPECGFIALQGTINDGHAYIYDAIEHGTKMVLCEKPCSAKIQVLAAQYHCVILVIKDLKAGLPTLLNTLFVAPSTLNISAVTGTNGKTSVASLTAQLALAKHQKTACLGTLGLNLYSTDSQGVSAENIQVGCNTTPDIVSQYKILAHLQHQHIQAYCLEASSHGIEQQRLAGLPIDTVVFTNLTQDHLDYHHSMAAYAQAKRGLLTFASLQQVIVNADDPQSQQWVEDTPKPIPITWYGLDLAKRPESATHYCFASEVHCTASGTHFLLHSSWGVASVHSPLLGMFNVSNLLAALCVRLLAGDSLGSLIQQVQVVKGVSGRMELFVNAGEHANMIVDYAHTPDALKQALIAARKHSKGKLFCVFGCGGERDKSKRPLMGAVASQYSDVVVLTEDNSRSESPLSIVQDIQTGTHRAEHVHVELDRKSAIRWSLINSHKQDLILVAGKGHEEYLEINNQRIAYNEREYVKHLSMGAER